MDPLNPNSWYDLNWDLLMKSKVMNLVPNILLTVAFKGAKSVLSYYNNSLPKALLLLFPEIGLQEDKFTFLPSMSLYFGG